MAQKYTRNMIRNVFIEMLDERPFDEITEGSAGLFRGSEARNDTEIINSSYPMSIVSKA